MVLSEELPQETPEQYNACIASTDPEEIRKRRITKIVKKVFFLTYNKDGIIKTLLTYEWSLDYIDKDINYVGKLLEIIDKHPDLFPLTDKLYNMFYPYRHRDIHDNPIDVYRRQETIIDLCIDLGYGYIDEEHPSSYLNPYVCYLRKGYYSKSGEVYPIRHGRSKQWKRLHNYVHSYITTL
jgi:hypothetical protein